MVELLIAKGANINSQTNDHYAGLNDTGGKTPLHYATEKNALEVVELLLSKGADINIKDRSKNKKIKDIK